MNFSLKVLNKADIIAFLNVINLVKDYLPFKLEIVNILLDYCKC